MKKADIYDLIRNYDIGMMTNINEQGKLVSHPMTRQGDIKDDVLWFFSRRNAEKIEELKKNDVVNVSFTGDEYLSVSGNVSVVNDAEKKKELWSKPLEAFFESEPEDDQIILLKVDMDSIEYWTSDNIFTNTFEFTKAMTTDKKADLGENDALDV
ncbi:pyridoxamine 5'-phosphate oxidase family protein [Alkalibacterium kapii]|uniref:General stress protein FMN-binding split barrel domain-containing protein n=1 Tax=Alkalibacterium kapii TaxID=426704 RepID=A0A511AVR0_9LACT|nr:pyridoxamine 5'-phosphate oxidase family protein [Alkalibacterium kapii]GEK91211.1 hypothetical protein AKA01nite_08330 [Alkalibacterium kapii]